MPATSTSAYIYPPSRFNLLSPSYSASSSALISTPHHQSHARNHGGHNQTPTRHLNKYHSTEPPAYTPNEAPDEICIEMANLPPYTTQEPNRPSENEHEYSCCNICCDICLDCCSNCYYHRLGILIVLGCLGIFVSSITLIALGPRHAS
jgi:hypothetical protein